MTVDYQATLNPENGLALDVRILPPDGATSLLWTVAVDIGQERNDDPDAGIDMSWVGAAGVRRGPTFARAAGEAVERRALIADTALKGGRGLPDAPRGAGWADLSSCPDVQTYAGFHYGNVGSPREVAVPAGAVDFPLAHHLVGNYFDPGPSGTAAGTSTTAAMNSAAKEILERNAAMSGWDHPDRAIRCTLSEATIGGQAASLASAAQEQGVDLELVLLEQTSGGPVWMVLALDREYDVVAAGLGLEQDSAHGALRALQEALQIRALLINMKSYEGTVPVALPITGEMARARYWASRAGIVAASTWLANVPHERQARRAARVTAPPTLGASETAWLEYLPEYTTVDLSARLPPAIHQMGWRVIKMFCPSLAPLRMSDGRGWNVLHPPAADIPHPFI